jgi:hypothetical protein
MKRVFFRFFSDLVKKSEKPLRTSPETYSSIQDSGYSSNIPATLDPRNNELASKVLESGQISLKDESIPFKSADLSVLKQFGEDSLQANLGETKLYSNDEILLEDVDPKNIPRDKEIVIWPKKAQIFAFGVPTEEVEEKNIHSKIFHERKARHGARFTWKNYFFTACFLPFAYFFAVFLEVFREFMFVNSFYVAVDRENLELIRKIRCVPEMTVNAQEDLQKYYPQN